MHTYDVKAEGLGPEGEEGEEGNGGLSKLQWQTLVKMLGWDPLSCTIIKKLVKKPLWMP